MDKKSDSLVYILTFVALSAAMGYLLRLFGMPFVPGLCLAVCVMLINIWIAIIDEKNRPRTDAAPQPEAKSSSDSTGMN